MTKKPWYHTLLTPQTVLYLLGAMVGVVVFWTRTEDSWNKQKALSTEMPTKADVSDLKSLEDRVNKQYQTNREMSDRIVALEKLVEYQRGRNDHANGK